MKTPSEMTNKELRKRAVEIYSQIFTSYKAIDANDPEVKIDLELIEQILLSVREEAIKECAKIAIDCENHYIQMKILALLPTNEPKEKV